MGKKPSSNVSENIQFLKNRSELPVELVNSLDELRDVRNDITHDIEINPNSKNLRLLKKLKDELKEIVKE